MARTLIVMARAPAHGRGKTRLARSVGRAAALRINRALQSRTLRVAMNGHWITLLAVTPVGARNARLPGVWPLSATRMAQGGGDLGARLARVMRRVRGHVAVIGTDCPEATPHDIDMLFRMLAHAPVVIGPAADGGFWGLAARRTSHVTRAFIGVRWSTAHTLADLAARLRVKHVRLRALSDIDTIEDWRAYRLRKRR